MSAQVAITNNPYTLRNGETINQFRAYCTSCHRHVSSNNGRNDVWSTKVSAVNAAKAHIEAHPYIESYLERAAKNGTVVVASVG